MGTRGVFGFRKNGQDKVVYNHNDSYPEGLGRQMAELVASATNKEMDAAFERITFIDENVPPTPEQIEALKFYADTGVSSGKLTEWYVLLRRAQGNPGMYVDTTNPLTVMEDYSDFLKDSLFCEWAYIVNLDDKTLEVHKGFNTDPNAPGRYAALKAEPWLTPDGDPITNEYTGVTLFHTFPLSAVRRYGANAVVKKLEHLRGRD